MMMGYCENFLVTWYLIEWYNDFGPVVCGKGAVKYCKYFMHYQYFKQTTTHPTIKMNSRIAKIEEGTFESEIKFADVGIIYAKET